MWLAIVVSEPRLLTPSRSPAVLPFWCYEEVSCNYRQCVAVVGGRGNCPRRAPVRTMSRLRASYFILKPSKTHESRTKKIFFLDWRFLNFPGKWHPWSLSNVYTALIGHQSRDSIHSEHRRPCCRFLVSLKGQRDENRKAWGSGSGEPTAGECGERRKRPQPNIGPAPRESADLYQREEATEREAIPTTFLGRSHWRAVFMREGDVFWDSCLNVIKISFFKRSTAKRSP